MPPQDAGSSFDFPNYHATLTDGTTVIPIIFSDGQGKKNIRAFNITPYPRTALKTMEGDSKYADLEPPYFAKAQDDFTGGRGNEDFESDTSRYFDGHHVDTNKESGVVLAGRETYSTGYRNMDTPPQALGNLLFETLQTSDLYWATSFVASASYTTYQCEMWVKRVGDPGNLTVELWTNVSSAPGAMLCTKTLSEDTITTDTLSVLQEFVWTGAGSNEDINATTTYWVVVYAASYDSSNYWQVGSNDDGFGKYSSDGSSWGSLEGQGLYFRITPVADNFIGMFFEYKRGLYMVTQPADGSNSALYINGDRGTADSNSGNKSNLEDSSKSWTNDEWIGDVVLITKGPGSDEDQNWRNITDNDSNSLVCSPDWNVAHTTATEYVILGSDKWTSLVADLDYRVVDVTVAGEYIYFTPGTESAGSKFITRYRYYTSSGAWATFNGTENYGPGRADNFLAIRNTDGNNVLYSSHNELDANFTQPAITKYFVPEDGQDRYLFFDQGSILPSLGASWTGTIAGDVTYAHTYGAMHFAIATAFSTGTFGIHNFDTPVDISNSERIKMLVMSTINTASTDIDLLFDDVEDLGKTWSPVKVLLADYARNVQATKIFHNDTVSGAQSFTDKTIWYDSKVNATTGCEITWAADDYVFVGCSEPFNKIVWNIGGTDNTEVQTMSLYYLNGETPVAVSGYSDTTLDGGATLGQDGHMLWDLPGTDWVQTTLNNVEAYWILLDASGDLTVGTQVLEASIGISDNDRIDPLYVDLANTYDGTETTNETLTFATEDYLYVGHGTKFNSIGFKLTTMATEGTDLTAQYFNGYSWTSVTITDLTQSGGDSFKQDGAISFTIPEDWEAKTVDGTETYWIRLDNDTALTTEFTIDDILVTRQNNLFASIPALVADTWTWVYLAVGAWAVAVPDKTSIQSIGLEIDSNLASLDFYVKDVRLATLGRESEQTYSMPASFRINGMEAYSGNADDPVENPWLFTEKGVYELQTQNDDQIVAIPLKELSTLQSSENGLGHTVNGTYLYFNIGEKVERYFNRTLDDVGPDRDEGLPDDRPGIPMSMTSYPGRIYTVIDANTGTSSLLTMRGTAWSEVYRAPRATERIRSTYVQAIPGTNVDRLWFSMGSDILWVPISLNPYNETDFTFTHEGHLITSWIYAGMMDVQKLWKSLKIFLENVGNASIRVDYRIDTDTTWTEIGIFNTAPVEEIDIASTHPMGKRIRYRLRFISFDGTTPRLKAIVTEGMAFVPVKNKYSFTFTLAKGLDRIDTKGVHDDSRTPAQDWTTLNGWANDGQQLTFATQVPMADASTVIIDPMTLTPLQLVPNSDKERYVCQLSALEV